MIHDNKKPERFPGSGSFGDAGLGEYPGEKLFEKERL